MSHADRCTICGQFKAPGHYFEDHTKEELRDLLRSLTGPDRDDYE